MSEPLRLLLIEDSDDDALLLLQELGLRRLAGLPPARGDGAGDG